MQLNSYAMQIIEDGTAHNSTKYRAAIQLGNSRVPMVGRA